MNPNQIITVLFFIAIATLLSAGVGWLIKKGILPLKKQMNFSEKQWQFMRVWVKIALVVGVILGERKKLWEVGRQVSGRVTLT